MKREKRTITIWMNIYEGSPGYDFYDSASLKENSDYSAHIHQNGKRIAQKKVTIEYYVGEGL